MPIPVNCPQCRQSFQLADKFAGCKIRCPKCSSAEILVADRATIQDDASYQLKPLAAGSTAASSASPAPADPTQTALRVGLILGGVLVGAGLLVGGVVIAAFSTWGAVAGLGSVELPAWQSDDTTPQSADGSFRPTPKAPAMPPPAGREPAVMVRGDERSPAPSPVIVSAPAVSIPGHEPRPSGSRSQPQLPPLQLVTYHGARHPFVVDLPTHNVVIFQHGSDTVYQWAPGPGGGPNARTVDRRFLFRVVHHHRLPGEGDLAAIERLEQTRNVGWPGMAFPPERITKTTPTIAGYRAVDRQLIGDSAMVWMSLSVAHPSGIYELQGMGRPTDVSRSDFEAIKRSFRFTR